MTATAYVPYSYKETLEASEKVLWTIADIIGGDRKLDFSKPFMPESLARVEQLDFLNDDEKLVLNQIRGNEYLSLFGIVEEYILPFVIDHARPLLRPLIDGDDYRVRALLNFAEEEAKHIQLFRRFREEFAEGFGTKCEVIGPAEAIGRAVLAHHPLAVALNILHIEWMTQRHYTDSVTNNKALDPQFKSLLKHHWMEEAQHAKLDTLMVEALAEACTEEEVVRAFDEYLAIGMFVDDGLGQQIELNLDAFTRATGRSLRDDERRRYLDVQRQAVRWTYLGSGMNHPKLIATIERLNPALQTKLEEIAPAFS
ncbi:MAG TPA: hypothetical protein VHW00_00360 [Thermoanaerobaculia bacterium]|nr:hypothetical protein [Thermoanaerobaculia bacterium]